MINDFTALLLGTGLSVRESVSDGRHVGGVPATLAVSTHGKDLFRDFIEQTIGQGDTVVKERFLLLSLFVDQDFRHLIVANDIVDATPVIDQRIEAQRDRLSNEQETSLLGADLFLRDSKTDEMFECFLDPLFSSLHKFGGANNLHEINRTADRNLTSAFLTEIE